MEKAKEGQRNDPELVKISEKLGKGTTRDFSIKEVLRFRNHLYVLKNAELIKELLKESHDSTLSTQLESTKMYLDVRTHYWWPGMKKDITDYVAQCLICQRVKNRKS